jgi:hypothetical protein
MLLRWCGRHNLLRQRRQYWGKENKGTSVAFGSVFAFGECHCVCNLDKPASILGVSGEVSGPTLFRLPVGRWRQFIDAEPASQPRCDGPIPSVLPWANDGTPSRNEDKYGGLSYGRHPWAFLCLRHLGCHQCDIDTACVTDLIKRCRARLSNLCWLTGRRWAAWLSWHDVSHFAVAHISTRPRRRNHLLFFAARRLERRCLPHAVPASVYRGAFLRSLCRRPTDM